MSNIINKVKDAVTGHGHSHPNDSNTPSTNHGPHNANVANKADPRVDSDLDGRAGTGNYTSSTNAGPHNSNIANKLDPRVDSDRDGSGTVGQGVPTTHTTGTTHGAHTGTHGAHGTHGTTHTTGSSNYGPHDSNLLNKADPRVDSDRDGSRNYGAATGATGASAYGNTGYTGTGSTSTNHGPHDSNLLNKVDPRVDSDRDGSRNFGAATGASGASAYTSGAPTTTSHSTHTAGSTNHGPHNSNLLNKADPRIDSDRDGSRNFGAATGASGASAYTAGAPTTTSHSASTNHGPHDSNLLNKADPRVDSDRDGSRNYGAATGATGASAYGPTGTTGTHGAHGTHGTHGTHGHHGLGGTGPAPNTAGPHGSDLLNKVDPRVDSDLDGSKTVGGRTTY